MKEWKGNDVVFKTYVKGKSSGDGKAPATSIKGKKNIMTFSEASKNDCFGAVLNDDFIDISFDSDELSQKFWNMAEENSWNCLILENVDNGHIHSFWKDSRHRIEKDGTDKRLAVGLIADIHSGSTYIPLRVHGSDRFPPSFESETIDEVPDELLPVNTNISLIDMTEGQGRNSDLFKYILVLQSQLQLDRDEIRRVLTNTNRFIFSEPLDDNELDVILRDDAFEKPVFYHGKTFLHNVFGDYLIRKYHIVKIDGKLHVYQDGIYIDDAEKVEQMMVKEIPTLKANQRVEVMKYLNVMCMNVYPASPNLIAFRNGILNIDTDEFLSLSPEYVITNIIPWDYNKYAYDEIADGFLNRISCDDPDIRSLLEECIGYCFYRKNNMQKAFILTGDKSNGKSTFTNTLEGILGKDNFSALALQDVGKQFKTVQLFGMLANIGGDISDEFIPDPSLFKKITGGDTIDVEYKYQQSFKYKTFAKCIFSTNNMPRIKDKTGAVIRRLIMIPFNAKFSESDSDYDPDMEQKLSTQSSMEYLVMLGVEGLKRVLTNKHFTKSRKVQKELDDYERNNHPELIFYEELELSEILNHETKEVYARYDLFCHDNGFKALSQIELTKSISKHFGITSDSRKIPDGKGGRKSARIFLEL